MPADNSAVHAATFASLGVPAALLAVLDDDGITTPFPIQAATLPDALAGRDILGRAKTGSGKTLGYALPMVARLAGGRTMAGRPRGLVLVPTRELATQVHDVLKPLAKALGLWVTTIYGGVSQNPQVNALRRRTDVIVATPGRLADLIGQGHCDLGDVEITVIDEADQMADLGFLPVVRRLLEATPSDGQRMLFSATLDSAIDVLARRFLTDPAHHSVDEYFSPAEIEHHVLTVNAADRVEVIAALVGGDKRSLVFTRTKHGAERLARQLTTAGIPAAELHGNLRQGARSRNLAAFGSDAVRVMVATDIAARGIHVDGIDLVIHADPPAEHKAYVHRSGRTARGGADGVVVTMQTKAQAREVTQLMRKAGVTPQVATAEPDSEVLREIGGPPAPRVTLLKSVTDLVKPEDRFSGPGQSGAGRPGRPGRPGRSGQRSERQRRPRADSGRPARRFGDAERSSQSDRGDRGDRPARRFDDRAPSAGRGRSEWAPAERSPRRRPGGQRGDWAPAARSSWGEQSFRGERSERGTGNRAWRGNPGAAEPGGRRGGATGRSGYSGTRSAGGKRQNTGQGRHS